MLFFFKKLNDTVKQKPFFKKSHEINTKYFKQVISNCRLKKKSQVRSKKQEFRKVKTNKINISSRHDPRIQDKSAKGEESELKHAKKERKKIMQ